MMKTIDGAVVAMTVREARMYGDFVTVLWRGVATDHRTAVEEVSYEAD